MNTHLIVVLSAAGCCSPTDDDSCCDPADQDACCGSGCGC